MSYLTEKERSERMKKKLKKLLKFVTPEMFESMESGDRYEFTYDFYWSFTITLEDDGRYWFYIEGNLDEDGLPKNQLVCMKAFKPSSIAKYIKRLVYEFEYTSSIDLRNLSPCIEDSPCNNCLEWDCESNGIWGCPCLEITDKICSHCPCHVPKD